MATIASDVGQWGFRLFEKEKPSKVGEEEATKPSAEEVVKPPVIEESSSLVEEAIVVATEDKEAEAIKEETAPIEPVAVQLEREPSAAAVATQTNERKCSLNTVSSSSRCKLYKNSH